MKWLNESETYGKDSAYLAPNGVRYESPHEYVWSGVMGFCDCVSDEVRDGFFEVLERLWWKETNKYIEAPPIMNGKDDRFTEFVLFTLDKESMVFHGGSIVGAFLVEKGHEVCELLWGKE